MAERPSPRRDEFDRIKGLFAPLSRGLPGAMGLSDDAALLDIPVGQHLVVTSDALVAGVHFFPTDPPALIAQKVLRVNLSDLAAMGAKPLAVFSACVFPETVEECWIEAFAGGLAADLEYFGVPLGGGDTVSTRGPATFCVTALGLVPHGTALLRAGAQAGDWVVVSGTLGDGALGLLAVQGQIDDPSGFLSHRYHVPEPRLNLGWAARGVARAGMDISDGLLQDVGHLCALSGLGAIIERDKIPLSTAGRAACVADPRLWPLITGGGDDYELLLAVPPPRFDALCRASDVPLTVIGRFTGAAGVHLVDDAGHPIAITRRGYRHH